MIRYRLQSVQKALQRIMYLSLKATFVDAKGQDKGQQAGDAKFEVHIDKKPVEYKEIANSKDARILQIDVSKNDRTIEII